MTSINGIFEKTSLILVLLLSGCAAHQAQPYPAATVTAAEQAASFISSSQRELSNREYGQAFQNYLNAVEMDSTLRDTAHFYSILYSWAISESGAGDIPQLSAQMMVTLEPEEIDYRRQLMATAVNRARVTVSAFGIGVAPSNIESSERKQQMARRAALTDARRWIARLSSWARTGVEGSMNVSAQVAGTETIGSTWIDETIFVIKIQAPLGTN